jgi:predicted nucleic acid-binding protein
LKQTLVMDAGVLALHFAEDSRLREYFARIDQGKARGLVTEVNLSECYYKTCQKLGRQAADTTYFLLRGSKLQAVQDEELTRSAGLEKCRQQLDLSLADCFALALARREKALLLTTDSELKKAENIQVRFFDT